MIYYRLVDEGLSPQALHEAAHGLLDEMLEKQFGITDCRIEKNEHGKPFLPDYPHIHFNLSHCRGLVLCGFSDGEIGVDAELIRPYNGRAAKRIFSPGEMEIAEKSDCPDEAFFRIWTLKEALGKCIGTGLFSSLANHSFTLCGENPVCGSCPEKKFFQKIIQKKWVVSVCADNP